MVKTFKSILRTMDEYANRNPEPEEKENNNMNSMTISEEAKVSNNNDVESMVKNFFKIRKDINNWKEEVTQREYGEHSSFSTKTTKIPEGTHYIEIFGCETVFLNEKSQIICGSNVGTDA